MNPLMLFRTTIEFVNWCNMICVMIILSLELTMSRKKRNVWYRLVNADGTSYKENRTAIITVQESLIIAQFLKEVFKENGKILPDDLMSSQSTARLSLETEPLEEDAKLDGLGVDMNSPIYVVLPESAKKQRIVPEQYYVFFAGEAATTQEVGRYYALAERMRGDDKTRNYIDELWEGFINASNQGAFNAICVPSGTGKTQLAFALPEEKCRCIYFNMAVAGEYSFSEQPVYGGFRDYMRGLAELIRNDCTKIEGERESWVYGFLVALLRLLRNKPESRLPGDLTQIMITPGRPPGDVAFEVVTKSGVGYLKTLLQNWKNENSGKRLAFFVDEFTPDHPFSRSELALFRRLLMDIGECVIVASTDSGALNMFNAGAATVRSREMEFKNIPWVQLCTRLPAYVPDNPVRQAVEACADSELQIVLRLCIESRPLFAGRLAEKIRIQAETLKKPYPEFFEDLRTEMIRILQSKRASGSVEGCYGYVTAMLTNGVTLFSNDPISAVRYGNLSTKSWAYLVNDHQLLADHVVVSRKDRDAYKHLSIKAASPSFMLLYRNSLTDKHELIFRTKDNQDHPFTCRTFFPDVKEDFLFYLAIAGSAREPGLRLENTDRISVGKLVYQANFAMSSPPGSVNAPNPDDQYHEALVCAAFAFACSAGPLTGYSLEELVTRFVAELMISRTVKYPKLKLVDRIDWGGKFTGKFVLPFDEDLPDEVHHVLGSTRCSRPKQEMQIDAVTFKSDLKQYDVIVEAKSSLDTRFTRDKIKDALNNQDSNAKVAFIVVDKKLVTERGFDTNSIFVLNRSMRVGKTFEKKETLLSRIYYVRVETNNGSNQI